MPALKGILSKILSRPRW